MTRRFQRTIEDFTCLHCGAAVQGNGYTNHCPNCLWSRHVDVNPGDRACACGGAMPPVSVESKGGEYIITHRCEVCGFERRNRSVAGDNFEALLDLARR